MFRIETYTNPQIFYNNLKVQDDELHITVIPVLEMYMKKRASEKQSALRWNVHMYHKLYQYIYPSLASKKQMLDRKQVLRHLIYEEDFLEGSRETLLAQIEGLYETYEYWLLSGLDQIEPIDERNGFEKLKIKLFKKYMEEPLVNQLIQVIRHDFTQEEVEEALERGINRPEQRVPEGYYSGLKRIYIYAMNYIEPIRYQFFERLVAWGYEVIFRIPYDPNYPKVHQAWKDVYSKIVPFEAWQCIQASKESSSILSFLEGRQSQEREERGIHVHTYSEPTLFKKYLAHHKLDRTGHELIACQEDLLNEYFRDEIDPDKEVTHIFETPVGRFLRSLYQVEVREDTDFMMDYGMYQELLTSGVINVRPQKGRVLSGLEAVSLLSDLSTYMEGVHSLAAIQERLRKLKELSDVSEQFDDLARSKVDRNHVKRYLQNPFRAFGFVNLQGHDVTINQLIALTDALADTLETLLVTYAPDDMLKEHRKQVVELITHSLAYEKRPEALDKVYQGFLNKFAGLQVTIYEPKELIEYIAVLGKIQSEKHLKGELILIKGIEHALGFCVNGVEELVVCDLSTTAMDQYVGMRQKRIALRTLESMMKYTDQLTDPVSQGMIKRSLDITAAAKRHIQSFVKFNMMLVLTYYPGKLHIGWIKNMHAYDTEWYLLSIIRQLYTVQVEEETTDEMHIFEGLEEEGAAEGIGDEAIRYLAKEVSPFAFDDLAQCPKKFYYANLLHHYPVYQEDFTQRIAFGWLGKFLEEQFEGKTQVREQLFPLFPQWTEALKENLVATTEKCSLEQYESFDNIKFPKEMERIWSLGRKGYKAKSVEEKCKEIKNIFGNNQVQKATPSKKCYFCPYNLICQEGAFAVDNEY